MSLKKSIEQNSTPKKVSAAQKKAQEKYDKSDIERRRKQKNKRGEEDVEDVEDVVRRASLVCVRVPVLFVDSICCRLRCYCPDFSVSQEGVSVFGCLRLR